MTTVATPPPPNTVRTFTQSEKRLILLSRIIVATAIVASVWTQVWGIRIAPLAREGYQLLDSIGPIGVFVTSSLVGLVIISRHPRHIVGWLLLASGVLRSFTDFSERFTTIYQFSLPGSDTFPVKFLAWVGLWLWLTTILIPLTLIPFYFPNGKLLTKKWRWTVGFSVIGMIIGLFSVAIHPGPFEATGVSSLNPFFEAGGEALAEFLWNYISQPMLIIGMSGAFLSIILRYRRSTGLERTQMKWVLYAVVLLMLFNLIFAATTWLGIEALQAVGETFAYPLQLILLMGLPITVGIAILQRGLYDINIIINRSLVYGSLTVFLLGIFAGGFVLVRVVLESMIGGDQVILAVAVPAVVATAVFNPVRRWLRRFVDKRFYGIELDYTQVGKLPSGTISDIRTNFGDYTGLEKIGWGGMGKVYRGLDPNTNQTVAIKILPVEHEDKEEMVRRFSREAQTVEKLDHPNIVKLYSVGAKDGAPFMVMEYIDGYDLSAMLREHRQVSLDVLLPILTGIASALDYAHLQGIVHRDIKPSNVMIERDTDRPVLMDFGIARIANAMTQLTGSGGLVGTMDYISPEQIQGRDDIDGRADVYSLGVMTYQMLTGQLPFKKNNAAALVMAHLMEPAPDPRKLLPAMPDPVADAIMQAMAKKAEDRFSTASAMVQMIIGQTV